MTDRTITPTAAQRAVDSPQAVMGTAGLLRGAFIYGGRQAAMTVLGIAANLLLTRLLVPRDFGHIAAITIVAGVLRMFAVGGIGLFLVQRTADPSDDELSAVRTLQLLLYVALQLVLVLFALAAPVLRLDAGLWWIIALSALSLCFGVLRSGSAVLLERRLAFGTIARIDVGEQLTNTTVMIALAAAGAGAWSVAIAAIVSAAVAWQLSERAASFNYRMGWPAWTPQLGAGVRFSAEMIAPSLIGAARLAALPLVVGGLAGLHVAGLAERAIYVATVPFALLGGIQQRILFTYTARVQHDRSRVRKVFHDAAYVSSVVDKIVYLPLLAFTPALVELVFSERWLAIVPGLQVAAWACALCGSFFGCAGPVLTGLGRARVIVRMNLFMLLLTWAAIAPLTLAFGATGYGVVMALMWLIAPYIFKQLRAEIGRIDLLHLTVLPAVAMVIAVVAVRAVAVQWQPVSSLTQLVVLSTGGIVLYLACLSLIDGGRLLQLARSIARSTRLSVGYGALES